MLNYLEQVVAFQRWKDVNPLPASAIALWYELMAACNKAGWPEVFTIQNALLQATAGMSRKEFDRARQILIDLGRIHYSKSKRVNTAGKYEIIPFPAVQKGQQEGQREEHRRGNERGNKRGALKDLIDQDLNRNEKKTRAEFVTMTDDQYAKLIDKYGEADANGMIESLSNYKGSKGATYKSDYHAILKWVSEDYLKRKSKPQSRNDLAYELLKEAEERERNGTDQTFYGDREHVQQLFL